MIRIITVYHELGWPYVAGIFSSDQQLDSYLKQLPEWVDHFATDGFPGEYPFYIYEAETGFEFHQTCPEFHDERMASFHATVYLIEGDYQPEIPWTDTMGNLPHRHPRERDEFDKKESSET